MLFKFINKWEKIVFYEFNIRFVLIFRKWKEQLYRKSKKNKNICERIIFAAYIS